MTKVNAMITTIDDVYDVYGILPELEQFTNAIHQCYEQDELERGDVQKSIQSYMHESGVTEVEAKAYIKQLTLETWKKLNKERQAIDSEF
ncbi:hypothetical protein CTI12_AA205080 [Artemisia annua]|uniref:Terpene synthase metal-binding domain-containing protein n=1 Tax=Artemisia annua TaxID=35608 RepID=A0A2U1P1H5_ARTAN|nr:hypothetical protein CTI12_AA205080 [Artemisia annua]